MTNRFVLTTALVLLCGVSAPGAQGDKLIARAGAAGRDGAPGSGHVKALPSFVNKREKERITTAERVARGQAAPNADGTVTLKDGRAVRYRLQGTEYLTAALIDFSDVKHGQIPQPDRSIDNSTYWPADVSPQHYHDMLFTEGGGVYGLPSMRDYYIEQSSGRFTWDGQVSNWVQVSGTEATYGANSKKAGAGGDDLNGSVDRVVDATLKALAASGNYGGIDLTLADQIDRYDCDGDGNFNEPDGYVDHFGIVHAGEGEEAGASGDAIWSHRSYANPVTDAGPAACQLGGYNLPGTDLWVGDYTIEPENGGVGVFAHEFGHDLGLPDLYDTAAPSNAYENGTGFWTLMSSGSWASDVPNTLDTRPVHMGAWEKLALGWFGDDLGRVALGVNTTVDLGPAETATKGRFQALRVDLPDFDLTLTPFPVDGSDPNYFYSTRGDLIDTNMSKALTPGVAKSISFRANWDIETDWDYAYLEVQIGGVWQPVQTSASTTTNPNNQNFGFGITGVSGRWTTVKATLPAEATAYRFRYWTDPAVTRPGIAVDTINVAGVVDNATSTAGWTFDGFRQLTGGQYTETYFHYYLVESRNYLLNDTSLCGAYSFISGNLLEKFCYANGLVIWYRNSSMGDNNVSVHPGTGQVLPIDAHPAAMLMPDGKTTWRARVQSWDSSFGLDAHSIALTQVLKTGRVTQGYNALPVSSFFDSSTTAYYNPLIPYNSVKTVGSGLKIDITGVSTDGASYQLHVYK